MPQRNAGGSTHRHPRFLWHAAQGAKPTQPQLKFLLNRPIDEFFFNVMWSETGQPKTSIIKLRLRKNNIIADKIGR